MIKGISGLGQYITVSGGTTTNPYISPGANGAGMLRWNPNMNQYEVNDGNSWIRIDNSYASVGMSPEAEMILNWAKQKMEEERTMLALAEKHPAVKIALENLNKAEKQLKATVILSKEHETNEKAAT